MTSLHSCSKRGSTTNHAAYIQTDRYMLTICLPPYIWLYNPSKDNQHSQQESLLFLSDVCVCELGVNKGTYVKLEILTITFVGGVSEAKGSVPLPPGRALLADEEPAPPPPCLIHLESFFAESSVFLAVERSPQSREQHWENLDVRRSKSPSERYTYAG